MKNEILSHSSLPQRISVKYYLEDPFVHNVVELIPVFHRWIQEHALEGILIDVADYSHVHHGPGLMLVAHEGHYRLDESDGRFGMEWDAKRYAFGSLEDRIRDVFQKTLNACRRLESERGLGRLFRFRTDVIAFRIRDRLLAANTKLAYETYRPALERVLRERYEDDAVHLEWVDDPNSGLFIRVKADTTKTIEDLAGSHVLAAVT